MSTHSDTELRGKTIERIVVDDFVVGKDRIVRVIVYCADGSFRGFHINGQLDDPNGKRNCPND